MQQNNVFSTSCLQKHLTHTIIFFIALGPCTEYWPWAPQTFTSGCTCTYTVSTSVQNICVPPEYLYKSSQYEQLTKICVTSQWKAKFLIYFKQNSAVVSHMIPPYLLKWLVCKMYALTTEKLLSIMPQNMLSQWKFIHDYLFVYCQLLSNGFCESYSHTVDR